MKLLAFDTSTEFLSAAVARDGAVVAEEEAAGGALASSSLIPTLQSLLERGGMKLEELDAIVFGRGPGSFTGLRTACAVAQGLGFGAGIAVVGVETLLAIAQDAREQTGADRVVAMLDARMSEVYAGRYRFRDGRWLREGEFLLARPETLDVPPGWSVAGNVFAAYGAAFAQEVPRIESRPRAAAMVRLAPQQLADGALHDAAHAAPVYIRDKVAQTTEERAQARAGRPTPT